MPALAIPELDRQSDAHSPASHGISLVVSPLLALMKDQVDALRRRGINAASLDSTLGRDQYLATMDSIKNGKLRLLYCAPERLNNEGFLETIKGVRGGVRMVAVDEAHCISEWGHAFRPDYLKIARFVSEIKAERVVCLTATATPKVAEDICDGFGVAKDGLFRTATFRPNLHLKCQVSASKDDKYPLLFSFLRAHQGATIIYVTLQKQSEALAEGLKKQGFHAKAFHAGMDTAEKAVIQDEFMKSNGLIICATIAFGMGIDKSDIRNIVHFDLPSSIEEYSQQIGRAGRDGLDSTCQLYLCNEDFYLRESFCYGDLPSKAAIEDLMHEIFLDHAAVGVGDTFMVNHYEQSDKFDIRMNTLNIIYAQLDIYLHILRPTTPQYSKYTYELGAAAATVVDNDESPTANAIRGHSKKAAKYYHLDVTEASSSSGISRSEFIRKLNQWNDGGLINLKASGIRQVYRVEQKLPTDRTRRAEIVDQLYSRMQAREGQDIARLQEVVNLMTAKECLSKGLAAYFGDRGQENGIPAACGHCTWCETHQQIVLPPRKNSTLDTGRINQVLNACSVRNDPRFLARIAFGISSPRVKTLKLRNNAVFGCMEDHNFLQLVEAFEEACKGNVQNALASTSAGAALPKQSRVATKGRGSNSVRPLVRGRGRGRGRPRSSA